MPNLEGAGGRPAEDQSVAGQVEDHPAPSRVGVDLAERVVVACTGGVGRIGLVRSPHNGIDGAMVAGLEAAVDACASCADLRVVLISATGLNFSVGGDLSFLANEGERLAAALDDMIGRFHQTLARLAFLEVPVVVAAQGAVAGGGLGLLWVADVVLAADDLRLVTGFAGLGLSGDGGSSWYLPRLIGLRRALEMAMADRAIDAFEALELGLVSSVVPLDALSVEAEAAAQALAAGPTRALGAIRRLYRQSLDIDLVEGLRLEQQAMVELADSVDGAEGIRAFLARRDPDFVGR